jgi:hypothetical protein
VALQSIDNPTSMPTRVVIVPILMVLCARVHIRMRQDRTFARAAAAAAAVAVFSLVGHKILAMQRFA